ncbi:hypothetical protein GCM10010172_07450 [Paractinoplanes ferrugineus]|uniref:Uncharacterized protein n=1 Tax=Paractinoplanes ferrugineus TaxID=113564 RepID=A0A919MLJ6_9ACTN|nr:hypothetical protein [Actinoplanes ferrugineus]GIE16890.1 hypothetical protein Afe05nite_87300 [Actinoplanes ferrugineus]
MDRLAALQEAIENTGKLAGDYPPQPCFEIHATDITIGGHGATTGWVTGALQRIVAGIAEAHRDCTEPGCATCQAIGVGVATSLESLYWMQDEELERRLNYRPTGRASVKSPPHDPGQ